MTRPIVIAANWKMNHRLADVEAFFDGFLDRVPGSGGPEVWIAPVALHLARAAERVGDRPVIVAAQNGHGEEKGAFTGELAAAQIADAGGRGVILGHSERRSLFGETDAGIAARLAGALAAGLSAIVCIGESLEVREAGRTLDVLGEQLRGSLAGCPTDACAQIRIAYEPVWAIGTGRRAGVEQVDEAHEFIRSWLQERFGYNSGSSVPVLYGGSVKPEGAPELLERPEVDGFLVGGASLQAESFAQLVEIGGRSSS